MTIGHATIAKVTRDLAIFVQTSPPLQLLKDLASARHARVYLTGGAIRDRLILQKPSKEIDLIIECEPSVYHEIWTEFNKESKARRLPSGGLRYDPMNSTDAVQFVAAFDVTVNALLFDLESEALVDPTERGVSDCLNRLLHPCAPIFFLPNPLAIVRAFRLSAYLDCELSPAALELLHTYPDFIRLYSHSGDALILVEFIKLLTYTKAAPQLEKMIETGILSALLPELAPLIKTRKDKLVERQHRLDKLLESTDSLEIIVEPHQVKLTLDEKIPIKKRSHEWVYNRIVVARLILLTYGIAESYQELPFQRDRMELSEQQLNQIEVDVVRFLLYRASHCKELNDLLSTLGTALPKLRSLKSKTNLSTSHLDPSEQLAFEVLKEMLETASS